MDSELLFSFSSKENVEQALEICFVYSLIYNDCQNKEHENVF